SYPRLCLTQERSRSAAGSRGPGGGTRRAVSRAAGLLQRRCSAAPSILPPGDNADRTAKPLAAQATRKHRLATEPSRMARRGFPKKTGAQARVLSVLGGDRRYQVTERAT